MPRRAPSSFSRVPSGKTRPFCFVPSGVGNQGRMNEAPPATFGGHSSQSGAPAYVRRYVLPRCVAYGATPERSLRQPAASASNNAGPMAAKRFRRILSPSTIGRPHTFVPVPGQSRTAGGPGGEMRLLRRAGRVSSPGRGHRAGQRLPGTRRCLLRHARRLLTAAILLAGTVLPALAGDSDKGTASHEMVTATYRVADLIVPIPSGTPA